MRRENYFRQFFQGLFDPRLRPWVSLTILFVLSLLFSFSGCLGGGGGGGDVGVGPVTTEGVVLSGRAYFAERQYYGGIPIFAVDPSGRIIASTVTDSNGNFAFAVLPPGIYDLVATTGESVVVFATSQSITQGTIRSLPDTPLLCVHDVIIDQISSNSLRIFLHSNRKAASTVEYGTAIELPTTAYIRKDFGLEHEITLAGLAPLGKYSFSIRLLGEDGQQFHLLGLSATTTGGAGPNNLSIAINEGEYETRNTQVKLILKAEQATEMRVGDTEDLTNSPWELFSDLRDYSLSDNPGTNRVFCQFRDVSGNESPVINDSILYTPSTDGYVGVWIEKGSPLTNKTDVTLTLLFPGATQMMLSDTTSFLNSFWETYVEFRKWKISSQDGQKFVYARFQGGKADPTKTFSASIILDTTGPEVTMKINGGAPKTNNRVVALSFVARTLPKKMQIQDTSDFSASATWKPFLGSTTWEVPEGDGKKTIYGRFQDEVGNIFGPISSIIELDTAPPTAPTITINDGASTTLEINVQLKLSAVGASRMVLSNTEDFAGATDELYKTAKAWTLGGYGTQNVYAKFLDDASNSSSIVVATILLSGTAPSVSSLVINSGDDSTDSINAQVNVVSPGAVKMRLSQNGNFNSLPNLAFVSSFPFTLSRAAASQTVYARFENASAAFSFASDSILVVGPSSYSLTTDEVQPVATYTIRVKPFAIGATKMALAEDPGLLASETLVEAYSPQKIFTLNPVGGFHTIYAKYRNAGGVETLPISLTITATGAAALGGPSIAINGGDATSDRTNFQLSVNAPNTDIMWVSQDGTFANSPVEAPPTPPQTRPYFFLSHRAGTKTVYTRFQKNTNPYTYATASIVLVGPASSTLTTSDKQPLNTNWVNLSPFAQAPVANMIVSENPGDMDSNILWIPYQNPYPFQLKPGGGTHTIYAKFSNRDPVASNSNYVESVPVQLSLSVLSTAPTNNTAAFKDSAALTGNTVTTVAVGSLPVWLHFTINDANTATVSWALASAGAPIPTVLTPYSVPRSPKALNAGDFPGNGVFNLWYNFSDGAGNVTPTQITSINVLGPTLRISPASVASFTSGQIQQFSANLQNVTGTVLWTLSPTGALYGAIDNTGKYTAPNPVIAPANTTVHAEISGNPGVQDNVPIGIETQVEIILGAYSTQISAGATALIQVTFKNTTGLGGAVSVSPIAGGGTATISAAIASGPSDYVATISYSAPAVVPVPSSVVVTVTSNDDPTKKKDLTFNINSGPWINVNPASVNTRKTTGSSVIVANTSSDPVGNVTWYTPYGSFDSAGSGITTKTTVYPHSVTFFTTPAWPAPNPVSLIASFNPGTGVLTATTTVNVTAAVQLTVSPSGTTTVSLGAAGSTLYQANVLNATTTAVNWEYKNASSSLIVWTPAGTQMVPDWGTLTVSGNNVLYYAPATYPSPDINPHSVFIRATSQDDGTASDTAIVKLIDPLQVVIHKGYAATDPVISSDTALLEVGVNQYFAEILNPLPGTNLTVSWYVEDIAGGNSTYGTIDSTGKYSAPTDLVKSFVTIKAVSNADTTRTASVVINLQSFWVTANVNMQNTAGTNMPIYSMMADPYYPNAADTAINGSMPYWLFSGTNGYGVWIASSDSTIDAASLTWLGIPGLNQNTPGAAQYIVNDIEINASNHDIAAATENGVYFFDCNGRLYDTISNPIAGSVKAIAWDQTDWTYFYVARGYGVDRVRLNKAAGAYGVLSTVQIRLSDPYRSPETRKDTNASPPVDVSAYSYTFSNLFNGNFTSLSLSKSDPNKLYFGNDAGEFGGVDTARTITSPLQPIGPIDIFFAPTGVATYSGLTTILVMANPPVPRSTALGYQTAIAIDPNSPWTLLTTSSTGVRRSTNNGFSFSLINGSSFINARSALIDPTNVTYFFYGCEDGLFRSKNAGGAWIQIKSGLGNNKTINTFTQSEGPPALRRRIWVGTTGGVFVGAKSLDLY